MKINEVLPDDRLTLVNIKALKKKKNNPKPSKTTKMNSFIDVFGGMAGYDSPDNAGDTVQT